MCDNPVKNMSMNSRLNWYMQVMGNELFLFQEIISPTQTTILFDTELLGNED